MTTSQLVRTSASVMASEAALDGLTTRGIVPSPVDVGSYLDSNTMPIDILRDELDFLEMPSGELLGEEFERKLHKNRYRYFNNRNRGSGIDLLSQDALFEWEISNWVESVADPMTGVLKRFRITVPARRDYVGTWSVNFVPDSSLAANGNYSLTAVDVINKTLTVNYRSYFSGHIQASSELDGFEGFIVEAIDTSIPSGAFNYNLTTNTFGGGRLGMQVCITPSPLIESSVELIAFIRNWIEWLIPHFKDNIEVVTCDNIDLSLSLDIGVAAIIFREAVAS